MIYKNIEIFNAEELFPARAGEGVQWLRVPAGVAAALESGQNGQDKAEGSTGVELRFVILGDSVKIRMAKAAKNDTTNIFHVYRGGIQGGWDDCELNVCVTEDVKEFTVKKSENLETLRKMAAEAGDPWDPAVVRVIFDRGAYRLLDVEGDVRPPKAEECPKKTLLFYGSSITHGSNAMDMSHSFASVVGHRLRMDVRNLGMAGTCYLEHAFIDYIAQEGVRGRWNAAVLELGINVAEWPEEKIRERSEYAVCTVAGKNPDKPVFVISPFYSFHDFKGGQACARWRRILAETVQKAGLANVTLFDGLSLLGDASLLCADEVHPNIYGVMQIADRLTERLSHLR